MTVLPDSLAGAAQYDLIVIGGGINGAAIAREAALLGHSVLLLEREDLCSGTSAAATRLIHGGLRYLEYAEFGLVYESLRERECLLRTAGHLVSPLPIYIPAYAGARRSRWQISLGLSLYDVLSWRKSLPWHKSLSSQQMGEALPGIAQDGLRGGACYYDAQITWPERLVVELCVDAAQNGAVIRTHAPVTQIIAVGGSVSGVEYEDAGVTRRAAAPVIVNAAGPWVDRIAAGYANRRLIGGTRGSHLILRRLPGLPKQALYVEAASDGRPFFIVPWNDLLLIGTTDVRVDGDPANVTVAPQEHRWLIEETQRLFPHAGDVEEAVCYGYSGIRPLPFRALGAPGSITRRHLVHRHTRVDGLFSIIGGKLTTHRALAEDVLRAIRSQMPAAKRRSGSATRALPGMLDTQQRSELEAEITARSDAALAHRLIDIYGAATAQLIELASESSDLGMVLGPESEVLVAELEYAFASQWAQTITDFLQRRCMSGLGGDRGLRDAEYAASWLVRLGRLERDESLAQVADYRTWLRRHRPVFSAR